MADNHGQMIEELNSRLRDANAEIERLRTLVGEEDQPGWDNCSRAEAIRQANQFHSEALTWMERHDDRRDERDAVQARLDAFVADLRGLCGCASTGCPCGGDRAAVTTRELRAILDKHAGEQAQPPQDFATWLAGVASEAILARYAKADQDIEQQRKEQP